MTELNEFFTVMNRVALAIENQTNAINNQAIAIGDLLAYLSDIEGGDERSPVTTYLNGKPK